MGTAVQERVFEGVDDGRSRRPGPEGVELCGGNHLSARQAACDMVLCGILNTHRTQEYAILPPSMLVSLYRHEVYCLLYGHYPLCVSCRVRTSLMPCRTVFSLLTGKRCPLWSLCPLSVCVP